MVDSLGEEREIRIGEIKVIKIIKGLFSIVAVIIIVSFLTLILAVCFIPHVIYEALSSVLWDISYVLKIRADILEREHKLRGNV